MEIKITIFLVLLIIKWSTKFEAKSSFWNCMYVISVAVSRSRKTTIPTAPSIQGDNKFKHQVTHEATDQKKKNVVAWWSCDETRR